MNGLEKPFRKKSDPKKSKKKNSKNQSEIAVNKKPLTRKRIFVQTPFSHYTLNLERKKIHAAKPLAFSLHFLLRCDQNHYSNLTSKMMKISEQILKKDSAPIQFKFFKNQEHRNIATLSLQLRSYNKRISQMLIKNSKKLANSAEWQNIPGRLPENSRR